MEFHANNIRGVGHSIFPPLPTSSRNSSAPRFVNPNLSPASPSSMSSKKSNPIESIDELLKQCQSYQSPNFKQKKSFYSHGHAAYEHDQNNNNSRHRTANNIEEIVHTARHQELMNSLGKISELIQLSNQKIFTTLEENRVLYQNEMSTLKNGIEQILNTQQKIQQDLKLLFQQTSSNLPTQEQATQDNSKNTTDTEQSSQQISFDHQLLVQSNEDLWLSLSSLTCSPPTIAMEEVSRQILSEKNNAITMKSRTNEQHKMHAEDETFYHSSDNLLLLSTSNKRKYKIISEDQDEDSGKSFQWKNSFEVAEGSDSDDYCWNSREK